MASTLEVDHSDIVMAQARDMGTMGILPNGLIQSIGLGAIVPSTGRDMDASNTFIRGKRKDASTNDSHSAQRARIS